MQRGAVIHRGYTVGVSSKATQALGARLHGCDILLRNALRQPTPRTGSILMGQHARTNSRESCCALVARTIPPLCYPNKHMFPRRVFVFRLVRTSVRATHLEPWCMEIAFIHRPWLIMLLTDSSVASSGDTPFRLSRVLREINTYENPITVTLMFLILLNILFYFRVDTYIIHLICDII